MSEFEKFLDSRNETIKEWKQYPDFFMKKKKIGKNRAVLVAGKNRGGVILLYSHMKDKDDDFNMSEEVNFMNWKNALEEYKELKTGKDILNLISRNR